MSRLTEPEHDIFTYAFCGDRNTFENHHLTRLSQLAESEHWTSKHDASHNFDILFYYIMKTFEVISKQGKISVGNDEEFSCFNTGLLTENGEEIYGIFLKNERAKERPDAQKWFFKGFFKESDRICSEQSFCKPKLAKYDKDIKEFHFDADKTIEFNADHIFDDHWDEEKRFPEDIKNLGKPLAVAAIKSAFDVMIKKIKRNPRLAVPQYYNGKIMFLLPIHIPSLSGTKITMALAVEKTANCNYRANTIFDLDSAYKKARLITKPESNWLIE